MNKVSEKKGFIFDVLKSALLSIIIGAIFILLFAVVLNYVPINDKIVTAINQAIKLIAVFVGCFFGFKERNIGLVKGILSGLIYSLGMALITALINKNFAFSWGVALDIGLGIVVGAISGVLAVNMKK